MVLRRLFGQLYPGGRDRSATDTLWATVGPVQDQDVEKCGGTSADDPT
jgi:hypothetical protein